MTIEDGVITIQAGLSTATFDARRGGRLASLVIAGRERIVAAPGPDDRSFEWGAFLMAPWAGRLRDGVLERDGRRHRFARNLDGHAIHGLVFAAPWSVEAVAPDGLELGIDLADVGWPFQGRMRQRAWIGLSSLVVEAEIIADQATPAALGWHPWFRRGTDDARLTVDAHEVLETVDLLPTGRRLAVSGDDDLRAGPLLGERRLDHVYVGARSPAVIRWPDLELAVSWDAPVGVLVVYTDADSFCVEPQTAWPNALAPEFIDLPEVGATMLPAGGSLCARMRYAWESRSPAEAGLS